MRRFSFLLLLLLGASRVSIAQSRSGSSAPSSSPSSGAASSHSSGPSGGSSSHAAGGSSGSVHSSAGSSHTGAGGSRAGSSTASANHGSPKGHSDSGRSVSSTDRDRSKTSPSSQVSSKNGKAKPGRALPAKVNPQQPTTKNHNWLHRMFHRRRPELRKAPKPCRGKNCPPPPPQPCKGRNCPPPPACGPGTVSNGHGGCVAIAGNDVCTTNPQAPGCPQSMVQNQYSNCALLQTQLRQAIMEQDRLLQAMNADCATGSQSSECISLTRRHNAAESQMELLRQRLRACRP